MLKTKRQIFWFSFFVLWIMIAISDLGLVSQQIHSHTRHTADWPTAEYYHVMGLLLFSTIIGLIFGIFHWALSLFMYMPIFLVSPLLFLLLIEIGRHADGSDFRHSVCGSGLEQEL